MTASLYIPSPYFFTCSRKSIELEVANPIPGLISWGNQVGKPLTQTQLPQSGKDKPHLACQPHRTVIRIQQNELHRLLYKLKCYLIQVIISRLY